MLKLEFGWDVGIINRKMKEYKISNLEIQELLGLPSKFGEFRRRVEERFDAIEKGVQEVRKKLDKAVGFLKGICLEMKVKENVFSFFSEHLLSARVIDQEEVKEALSLAVEKGIISKEERVDVLRLDLIVEGTLLNTEEPVLIAVEVFYTIDKPDVQRAINRAKILEKAMDKKVLPAVVGCRITEGTEKLITKTGCLQVLASE
jgi:hypothetical protein